jgi:hypothetical protein
MIMKKISLILVTLMFALTAIFTSCEESDPIEKNEDILPTKFKVDIPNAISNKTAKKSMNDDEMSGDEIYEMLGFFIALGEGAADIVQEIMISIAVYGINQPMEFPFEGDDDGRTKNLKVVENVTFEGNTYSFQLTITDAESEVNADGGKALQVLWNNDPVDGVAFIKPYNLNRNDVEAGQAIFRIDYNEKGQNGYDAEMLVQIADYPLPAPLVDPFAVNNIKLFAGKKGDIVDVYGNSNHPNASIFTEERGFNWAFVASGKESEDIGVAEIGLPPSSLDETSRDQLLGYYSIKSVFERAIYETWPTADSTFVAQYLHNTEAPGFFDTEGFVQGGTSPGTEYDEIESRLDDMIPFNPKTISELSIEFN